MRSSALRRRLPGEGCKTEYDGQTGYNGSMANHSEIPLKEGAAIGKPMAQESSITTRRSFIRRLHYWWSLFLAGALLGLIGPPVLIVAWLVRRHNLVYPWAMFGARMWLRFSGVRVKVKGLELLDP
ncbi:MAG TPA: hypothetical protein VFY60_13790, partial [Pyrinomonadaceae bacterium]|nr:hypothetical protein [Pyrinomonadaceae bacterium]